MAFGARRSPCGRLEPVRVQGCGCGVATRAQLLTAGVSVGLLRAQLDAGRWRALNDRVVCLHNGPLTSAQQRSAVFLSAQTPAAMCGRTAMAMWGVTGHADSRIHVLVRRGGRVLPVPGVEIAVHES